MRAVLNGLTFLFFDVRPELVVVTNSSGDDEGVDGAGGSPGDPSLPAAVLAPCLVCGPAWVVCGGGCAGIVGGDRRRGAVWWVK